MCGSIYFTEMLVQEAIKMNLFQVDIARVAIILLVGRLRSV
jgi:hypothetical protein